MASPQQNSFVSFAAVGDSIQRSVISDSSSHLFVYFSNTLGDKDGKPFFLVTSKVTIGTISVPN